ncbi:hypothetical protein IU405_00825, partial [Polaribacter sp. BAL334]|uniref:hypothetical protein n=1 Tax=Polaribacter sp. BAL334 TaxID=1708178 RepID=UPI0018D22680
EKENCGRIKIVLTSNSSKKKEIQKAYILKTEKVKIKHNYYEQQQTGQYFHFESRNYYSFEEEENNSTVVTEIFLYYLKSDPTNFNKIKKALEHLRNLCKAEDDPFGE